MEIYQVTEEYINAASSLFHPHEVKLLPKDFSSINADLIIFSGGADVHPSRYGSDRESDWTNTERDKLEFSVFSAIINGKLKTKKVLGICRGLQLMNVGMGGSLIFDIRESFGIPHKPVHPITWSVPSALSELLPVVNSMHHQGIQYVGDSRQGTILANEPNTRVIEAIIWSDKYLAFQFHPEFFPDGELKDSVGRLLLEWIGGNNEVVFGKSQKSTKKPDLSDAYKKALYTTTYGG